MLMSCLIKQSLTPTLTIFLHSRFISCRTVAPREIRAGTLILISRGIAVLEIFLLQNVKHVYLSSSGNVFHVFKMISCL